MITINYQAFGSKGFQLRLRLYQAGETKYINVTKLLKGKIQKRHWNQQKQRFIPSCPFSDENNEILGQLIQKYHQAAINWTGTVFGLLAAIDEPDMSENKASGFVLKADNQPTVYIIGDGVWTQDIYENIVKFRPDCIVVNSGGEGTEKVDVF